MRTFWFILLAGLFLSLSLQAQTEDDTYEVEPYHVRIKKSYINGVYIPKDLKEVLAELDKKMDTQAIEAFKSYTESEAEQKSYFGFGRWLSVNWGLEEGSRLSHHLQGMGLGFTEDMIRFLMVSYHRHLHERPLDSEQLIEHYQKLRKKKIEEEKKRQEALQKKQPPRKG
jgi:hypothetical protein